MSPLRKIWPYFGQGFSYLLFIAFIGYFSHSPSFTNVPPDDALIKFTFTHPGKRIKPLNNILTKAEKAKLPPQLRYRKRSRERSPLRVEFEMDGRILYQAKIEARGLAHDLPSPVYQRFIIPAGRHHFLVRMNDNIHHKGYEYVGKKTLVLAPLQTLIIDFNNTLNRFVFE